MSFKKIRKMPRKNANYFYLIDKGYVLETDNEITKYRLHEFVNKYYMTGLDNCLQNYLKRFSK